jgi:hypothetical protein
MRKFSIVPALMAAIGLKRAVIPAATLSNAFSPSRNAIGENMNRYSRHPGNGTVECARRRRQIRRDMLTASSGLTA